MRIIIRAVPDRFEFVNYLRIQLPTAEWCFDHDYTRTDIDNKTKSMNTFLASLEMSKNESHINMEEDVVITRGFEEKAGAVIAEHPDSLIQFFSMRKDDLTIGSRWDNNFMMNQCFYLPKGYPKSIADYRDKWPLKDLHPGGYDMMMGDWLRSEKLKYWIHVP